MSFPSPDSVVRNAELLSAIQFHLDQQKTNGTNSDNNTTTTIKLQFESVYGVSSPSQTPEEQVFWLQSMERLRDYFKSYYTPATAETVNPARFDNAGQTSDINVLNAFAKAITEEASAIVTPNVAVLGFLYKNAVVILLLGGVLFFAVKYNKEIRSAFKN